MTGRFFFPPQKCLISWQTALGSVHFTLQTESFLRSALDWFIIPFLTISVWWLFLIRTDVPDCFIYQQIIWKKTHFQSAASYRSTAFQFTPAVSLKSLVLALTGIFFSSLKTEEDIRPLYGLQVQLWDSSRQTWFVECYQRSQWAKKEDGVEGLSKEWGRRGKKGRQEEIEQHRCIMCACWHTKDVVFTAGAAARHGNVPRSHCTHSSK